MDPEDLQPKRVADSLAALARDDLSLSSILELQARITLLDAEIVRARAVIASKEGDMAAAHAFFKKP